MSEDVIPEVHQEGSRCGHFWRTAAFLLPGALMERLSWLASIAEDVEQQYVIIRFVEVIANRSERPKKAQILSFPQAHG